MNSDTTPIRNVGDTAIWVAYYRAVESKKSRPLFKDDLAQILTGTRGKEISDSMGKMSKYTQWSVVMRTYVIDTFIQNLVLEGVDTVINLGAGLDTRPYRMDLPPDLQWIEVDYPQMIEYKEKLLATQKPRVRLERISADLSVDQRRQEILKNLGARAKKALILTEGVILYMNPEQVSVLAGELRSQPSFQYWIAEYISPDSYKYLQNPDRERQMKNAPFLFFPRDWLGFFQQNGWVPREIRYLAEEGQKKGRRMPMPWWGALFRLFSRFMSEEDRMRFVRQMGYVVYQREGHGQ